jgi:hypothetical protein
VRAACQAAQTGRAGCSSVTTLATVGSRRQDADMRWVVALAVLVATGCSLPSDSDEDDPPPLITRPKGPTQTIWSSDVGTLRLEDGCLLFKGQLTAFPHGARLVASGTALQLSDDDEPVPVDGTTLVGVTGSEVPLGGPRAWKNAFDSSNLERWETCRVNADISEYADWWQVGSVAVVE